MMNIIFNIIKGVFLLPLKAVVVGAFVFVGNIVLFGFAMLAGIVMVAIPFILRLAAILAMFWFIGAVVSALCQIKKRR